MVKIINYLKQLVYEDMTSPWLYHKIGMIICLVILIEMMK